MVLSAGAPLNTRLRVAASLLMNWKENSAQVAGLNKHWSNMRLVLNAASNYQKVDEKEKALTPDAFAADYRRRELIDKWGPYDAYIVGANFDTRPHALQFFGNMQPSVKVESSN